MAEQLLTDEIVDAVAAVLAHDEHGEHAHLYARPVRLARTVLEVAAPLILARDAELHAIATEPCDAETWSWDHFRDSQVDPYWIRCKALGPHEEHEDSDAGLTWKEA